MGAYLRPRMLAILALGFASGLPLALTASTLSIWLTEAGVDKTAIGLFAAVAVPYSLKFLWAPFIDALSMPLLTRLFGRRRGWLFAVQALLMAAIFGLGLADPAINPKITAIFAFAVAAMSATQDIIIDAYRVEQLPAEDQTKAAALYTFGYRTAMLISGAGALYLAEYYGWTTAYFAIAALLPIGTIAVFLAGESPTDAPHEKSEAAPARVIAAAVESFRDFMTRPGWITILLFVLLYKFSDAFLGIMTGPFVRELGFSKTDIANIGKIFGFAATVAGGFAGAWLAARAGLMRALWIGGALNGASNLGFLWLAASGPVIEVYAVVNSIENFTGAMSNAVLVAYLSSLCNIRYTATQYALLSSLAAVARTIFSTPAGAAAKHFGWEAFFLFSALLALPGLYLLMRLGRRKPTEAGA